MPAKPPNATTTINIGNSRTNSGRRAPEVRPARQRLDQCELIRMSQAREFSFGQSRIVENDAGQIVARLAKGRMRTGVRVLDVKKRIVLRLLHRFGEVEVEMLIMLSGEHD